MATVVKALQGPYVLPNGVTCTSGDIVALTDAQFALVPGGDIGVWVQVRSSVYPSMDVVAAAQDLSLSEFAAPTGDLSINSHKLTNVTDPTGNQDAATKAWTLAQKRAFVELSNITPQALGAGAWTNLVGFGTVVATGDAGFITYDATNGYLQAQQAGLYLLTASGIFDAVVGDQYRGFAYHNYPAGGSSQNIELSGVAGHTAGFAFSKVLVMAAGNQIGPIAMTTVAATIRNVLMSLTFLSYA